VQWKGNTGARLHECRAAIVIKSRKDQNNAEPTMHINTMAAYPWRSATGRSLYNVNSVFLKQTGMPDDAPTD